MELLRLALKQFAVDTFARARSSIVGIRPARRAILDDAELVTLSAIDEGAERLTRWLDSLPTPFSGDPMTEDQKCDMIAEACLDGLPVPMMATSAEGFEGIGNSLKERLSAVYKRLRAEGVPWSRILALVGQIIPILLSGGSWTVIIQAILALFFPPTPTAQQPKPA